MKTTTDNALGTTNRTASVWDDYNLVAEIAHSTSSGQTTTNVFVWGLDLSGTLQNAGGVGGLLAEIQCSVGSQSQFFAAYDANGNITDYVSTNGTITAHREFDAFGNTIASSGPTTTFTHWFSTKPWDSVTGLSEYEYRKYSPELGRWLSRDPIGENGGSHLYATSFNNPLNKIDVYGLAAALPIRIITNPLFELFPWDDDSSGDAELALFVDYLGIIECPLVHQNCWDQNDGCKCDCYYENCGLTSYRLKSYLRLISTGGEGWSVPESIYQVYYTENCPCACPKEYTEIQFYTEVEPIPSEWPDDFTVF